jgi:hypothetical protein
MISACGRIRSAEAAPSVKQRSLAIWSGLPLPEGCDDTRLEQLLFATRRGGLLDPSMIGRHRISQRFAASFKSIST